MEKIIFKGRMGYSLIKEFLNPSTFIQVFIVILLLIGEHLLFPWFLIFGLVVAFLFNLLMGSWFSLLFSLFPSKLLLDDENRVIISKLPLRKNIISYERIKEIRILDWKDFLHLQAYVEVGIRKTKKVILLATNKGDKERLKEELVRRFTKVEETKSVYPTFFSLYSILFFFIIPFIGYLLLTFNIYTKCPQVKIYPQRLSWKSENISLENRNFYTLHSVKFSLPKEFELVEEKEELLHFKSREEAQIVITPAGIWKMFQEIEGIKDVLFLLGIKDNYDLLKVVMGSRIGTLPLLLKSIHLKRFDEVKIYELKKGYFKGFLLQGKFRGGQFKGKRINWLDLVDKKGRRSIDFFCSFEEEDNILKILGDIE